MAAGHGWGTLGSYCRTLRASQGTSQTFLLLQTPGTPSHPPTHPHELQCPGPTLALGTSILPGVFRQPSGAGACPTGQLRVQRPAPQPPLYRARHKALPKIPPGPGGSSRSLGDTGVRWLVARRPARPFSSFAAPHCAGTGGRGALAATCGTNEAVIARGPGGRPSTKGLKVGAGDALPAPGSGSTRARSW